MALRIKELRKQAGLTQQKLSEMSGISRPIISKLETTDGEKVNVHTLIAIADALKVEPSYLFLPKAYTDIDIKDAK